MTRRTKRKAKKNNKAKKKKTTEYEDEEEENNTNDKNMTRIKDHCGRDSKSHVWTHTMESGHREISKDDFTIISKSRRKSHYYFRKTTEAIMIKRKKPDLNAQEKLVPLKLFNWSLYYNVLNDPLVFIILITPMW